MKYTMTVERITTEWVDVEVEADTVEQAEHDALIQVRGEPAKHQHERSVRVIGNIHDDAGNAYV